MVMQLRIQLKRTQSVMESNGRPCFVSILQIIYKYNIKYNNINVKQCTHVLEIFVSNHCNVVTFIII